MECYKKLDILIDNLTEKLGLDPDNFDQYVYGCFNTSGGIEVCRVDREKETNLVVSQYSKNWTLATWKAFRDRCLLELS